MARAKVEQTKDRAYWANQIEAGKRRWKTFWDEGDTVIDTYRLQKADHSMMEGKDKYNILYSTTETTRPNLYAQKPRVMAELRHKDRTSQAARDAVYLLQNCCQYIVDEEDVDNSMANCVEDYLLAGLAVLWVRYDPTITGEEVVDERVAIEYVYWQDFMCGVARNWATVPWVARRCWVTKEEAKKRWPSAANKLVFAQKRGESRTDETKDDAEVAEVWEIWDKASKQYICYSDSYQDDLLSKQDDPLKLKRFFPCPRPLRAISNNRTMIPRAFYSQYKSQADVLNTMTRRIRLLSEALKVVGVYDASTQALSKVLDPNSGNRMVPVDNWAMFAQNGGVKGQIDWLPIDQIVSVLTQLLQNRDILKNEIYEITGFADVVRGVSKASETLGAQNLKANWAGARVKNMQREVQRFCRDAIALAGEILAEHCDTATLFTFGGIDLPPAPSQEAVAQNPQAAIQAQQAQAQVMQKWQPVIALLKDEKTRVAKLSIETDSTLLADEEAERQDRTAFLGAAGSFLQQAVPAMQTTPQLGPLLGAMLMFVVRTFPSSRPIEDAFQKVEQMMLSLPPQQGQGGEKGAGGADGAQAAQSAQNVAQIKAKTEADKLAQEGQKAQADLALRQQAEANRHAEKERELQLREREVALKEAELKMQIDRMQMDEHFSTLDRAMKHMSDQNSAANEARNLDMAQEAHENTLNSEARNLDMAQEAHEKTMNEPTTPQEKGE